MDSNYGSSQLGSEVFGKKSRQEFAWNIIDLMVNGTSPIDLPALTVADRASAYQFMLNYGYDLNDPKDRATVETAQSDALKFIKDHFLHGHSQRPAFLSIPSEIEKIRDVCELLIWASGPRTTDRQAWACAILRIMHTIHHMDNTMRTEFFPEIKEQILGRFRKNIIEGPEESGVIGKGKLAVPLYKIFYKEEKTRDSLIMKLLHKRNNVAERIHDRLGVKLVTYNRLDVMRVLFCLCYDNIITFANLTPKRSRNTLLWLDRYKPVFNDLFFHDDPNETEEERKARIAALAEKFEQTSPEEKMALTKDRDGYNPTSSSDYQSLQFTVQELVKFDNPAAFAATRLRTHLAKFHLGPELEGMMQGLESSGIDDEIRLLFPLEVQLIDKENYQQSIEGTASHAAYKQRQQDEVFERVMRGLLKLHPELDPKVKDRTSSSISLPGLG